MNDITALSPVTPEMLASLKLSAMNLAEGEMMSFEPAVFRALVEALEKAQQRIGELERSHKTLRETMAGIHNTIRTDGGYTPLVSILNASKRAYEESAAAAGIQVIEGEGQ
ncbi:hypothetical protein AB9B48_17110 [Kluyvera ascorbata]|uniref:hypothetical protein n=1 Tax=Kluyvera ascorbata TaxID=51288 RepID=UPI00351044F4